MSKKKNVIALFPELNQLRRALLEVQDDYAGAKPNLNEAIAALAPRDRSAVIDKISNNAATPVSKTVPEKVASQIRAFRGAIRGIDGGLRQDSSTRDSLFQGNLDEDIVSAFQTPLLDGKNEVVRLAEELATASFGARAIDQRHELEAQVDLLHVGLNAFFESLDLRHGEIEEDGRLAISLKYIGGEFGELAEVTAAKPIWALVGSWLQRWEDRPSYRACISGWLPFATITLSPVQNVDRYRIGDVIASAKATAGSIVSSRISAGRLPAGLEFNAKEGSIIVKDPAKLVAGTYSGVTFEVENDRGYVNTLRIDNLELGYDQEAVYTLIPNLFLDTLEVGDLLAYPTDPDGKMVGAQVLEGRIPAGASFDSITGEFRVVDPVRLKPANYPMVIRTYDEVGGESDHVIDLTILPPSTATTAAFHANDPVPLPVANGNSIAYVSVVNGYIVGAAVVSGALPSGVRLTPSANIVVINSSAMVPGSYSFNLSITTSLGEVINLPAILNLAGGSRTGTGGTNTNTPVDAPGDLLNLTRG